LQGEQASFNIKDLLRPATFVPESKRLNVLLREFRANHNHMAVVIDEYGGVAGLVTIEDVLEQIVGDIEDEHDVAEGDLVNRVEGEAEAYVADARAGLTEVSEATGVDLVAAAGEMAEEIDTLGGLIVTLAGRV
ncbi:CBS domain-containing protein, partial [Escherichia coli]|uniref:CBS domain-containing protein n=1 Tax=Escherichia coli TaxID=562 RepID=UPI0028FC5397